MLFKKENAGHKTRLVSTRFLACKKKKRYLANKAFLVLKWVLREELVGMEPEAGMSECVCE